MTAKYFVIASVEDNAYMAWQAKLFHHSCMNALGAAPLIFVHGMHAEPHPYLVDVVRAGGVVYSAPSYRVSEATGRSYPPRNTAGTLIHAAELCESDDTYFVLCDSDMLFVRAPLFEPTLSGDHYDYLFYDRPEVRAAAARFGVDAALLAEHAESLRVGVPYVVPSRQARALGEAWLEAIDAFAEHDWVDGMYAFGLAALRLGLQVSTTRHMVSNVSSDTLVEAPMIHYCYGDERWTKRDYMRAEQAAAVWTPPTGGAPGSVLAEIARQLAAVNAYEAAAHDASGAAPDTEP
jgi:hypothetical protein